MINILFLGQTPPPYHGQSIVTEKIVKTDFENIRIHHVRLDFSDQLHEIGIFSIKKIFRLFRILFEARRFLKKKDIDGIYYPPAGNRTVPIIRDIIILLYLRLFKKKLIFHFHALGLKDYYFNMNNSLFRNLLRKTYFHPDLSLVLSEYNLQEFSFIDARNVAIVNNGIQDNYIEKSEVSDPDDKTVILFLGNLIESKGVKVILDAGSQLVEKGFRDIKFHFVGGFTSREFEIKVKSHPLVKTGDAELLGVITGDDKIKVLQNSDVFCFPTYYHNETFPLVLLEAMQFKLPIIATNYRSIPEMVQDNINGILIEPENIDECAAALERLISNKDLRKKLGDAGREIYMKKFTEEIFLKKLESSIVSIF